MSQPTRRRHSARRYAVRRTVALVIVVLVGFGVVRVVGAVIER